MRITDWLPALLAALAAWALLGLAIHGAMAVFGLRTCT